MSVLVRVGDYLTRGRLSRYLFKSRLNKFLDSGQPDDGDAQLLNDAFARSSGRWLSEASSKLSARTPSYDFADAHDQLGLWETPGSFEKTLKSLTDSGYAILDTRLPLEQVDALRKALAEAPCTLTSDAPAMTTNRDPVFVNFDNPQAVKYSIETGHLIANPAIRRLLLDRGLLEIAQSYLGSAPIIDIVTAWYSFPSDAPSHQAAQLFHFDLDRIKWLKVFFLLTDQTTDTGAHIYVPGTHKDGGISKTILSKGYVRLTDEEVDASHPKNTWKSMEAPAGSILLEDTRGLHKGISVRRDYRLMLQFEYTQCLFGNPPALSTAALPAFHDQYWDRMKDAYPLTFEALAR